MWNYKLNVNLFFHFFETKQVAVVATRQGESVMDKVKCDMDKGNVIVMEENKVSCGFSFSF